MIRWFPLLPSFFTAAVFYASPASEIPIPSLTLAFPRASLMYLERSFPPSSSSLTAEAEVFPSFFSSRKRSMWRTSSFRTALGGRKSRSWKSKLCVMKNQMSKVDFWKKMDAAKSSCVFDGIK